MANNEQEESPLQQDERKAMTGDRNAVLRVVSALRKYRAAAVKLSGERYSDGEVDAVALHSFFQTLSDIEQE